MLPDRRNRPGVHVAREAHLERDASRDDLLEQGRVFAQPGPVPDALRPAAVERVGDRAGAVTFPGVAGAGETMAGGGLARRAGLLRRGTPLRGREAAGAEPPPPGVRRRPRRPQRRPPWPP